MTFVSSSVPEWAGTEPLVKFLAVWHNEEIIAIQFFWEAKFVELEVEFSKLISFLGRRKS